MKHITFEYEKTGLIDRVELTMLAGQLLPEVRRIKSVLSSGYTTDYASINVPSDNAALEHINEHIKEKKALNPTALVVIGIGGSNLGTVAVHEAIHGLFYNAKNPPLKFFCADTLDTDEISDQLSLVEQELKKGNNIILNVISKSGTTTETIANFELFLALLKKYKPNDYFNYVVVTSDTGSRFAQFAQQQQFSVLEIPVKIGGRYSVFSAVGLFPLGMLGINIERLLVGARAMTATCVQENIFSNPAAVSALLKYAQYQQCMNINDLFVFATSLRGLGLWYRQLMGESIGKEFNRNNQKVEIGITPTVSIGSTDLHSVGQLYLGGPRDKFTTFVVVDERATDLALGTMPEFEPFVAKIQGKKLSSIMNAILHGVQAAYHANKRPYCTIRLAALNEESVGAFMQLYMIEMMYLGFLFDVNPFDQPNVELYKKETRKLLANE